MPNRRTLPLLTAILALLCQIVFAAAPAAGSATGPSGIHICGDTGNTHAPAHQAPACHLCPLCFAVTHPGTLLAPAPLAAPAPCAAGPTVSAAFHPRAPPRPVFTAPYPTGPPALA